MNIRKIDTCDAIYYVLDEERFPHLLECMVAEGEVKKKRNGEYTVVLLNGRDFSGNTYTDPYSERFEWIAGFSDSNPDLCVALQLVSVSQDTVELVNCEKNGDERRVFPQIVEWIQHRYPGKSVSTFPMNSDLEEYYSGFGFRKDGDMLVKIGTEVDFRGSGELSS